MKKLTKNLTEQCDKELIENEAKVLYDMYKASDTLQDMVGTTVEYPGLDETTTVIKVTKNKCVVELGNGDTHTYTYES